ncbi:SH3 domain-containing protein [Priestia filamentosa]|uniref:SH3 domain-containing protein n=1 Tax=Priestia filamentosa TaxID=1402861 RepID=UPI00397C2155
MDFLIKQYSFYNYFFKGIVNKKQKPYKELFEKGKRCHISMFNAKLKKSSTALLVTALLVPGLSLHSKVAHASSEGIVNASSLNVREQASTNSKVLGKLKNNEVITVNKFVGKWAEITYNSKTAYVYSQYLDTVNSQTNIGKITASKLNIRSSADTYSSVIGQFKNGETITYKPVNSKWGEVTYNGKKGYVYLTYVQKIASSEATGSSQTNTGKITASKLNIRSSADTYSSVIGQFKNGETITYKPVNSKWGEVTYNGKKGYVYLSYVKKVEGTEATSSQTNTGKITASKLNIRSSADTYSSVIGQFKNGETITYKPVNSKWGEVTYNGKKGYVYLTYVQKVSNGIKMQTTASALNVRSQPNTSSSIIGKLTKSDIVSVEPVSSTWGKIALNGKTGYVSLNYLKEVSGSSAQPDNQEQQTTTKTGYVTASALNIRQKASTSSSIIGKLAKNSSVSILSIENNMAKISYNGGVGYVSMSYITYTKPSTTTTKPVENYYVNASALNVRNKPSLSGSVVGTLANGAKVDYVSAVNSEWAKIKYNNKDAYVSSQYLQKSTGSSYVDSTGVNYASLKNKVIMLDAGHGGKDSGTVGNGMYEKDITLDMVKRVKSKLESSGAKVILTRSDDRYLYLSERANLSNNSNANVFVSIHVNSATAPSARGVETFYFGSTSATLRNSSASAATNILDELLKVTNSPSRGVKTANFYVIKYNHKPSTLIELGFISNTSDASYLRDNAYRNKAADAIVKGLAKHFD